LVRKVTGSGNIGQKYTWDASGMKLAYETGDVKKRYLGAVEYDNSNIVLAPNRIQTEEGHILPRENWTENSLLTKYVYYYTLSDHLGNARLVMNDDQDAEVVQSNSYSAFGLLALGPDGTASKFNNRFYNGKEKQEGTGWLDYGARMYYSELGRWMKIDPLAEERMWVSPYNYAQNNPINRIDPDGALDVRPNEKALVAIQNGLSASDAKYVKLDSKGFIDKKLINSASSESGNFNALKQLVNDTKVYDVKVTDKLTYKDENGATKTQKMEVSYTDFITGEKLPQVEGAQGYTAVPGTKDPVNYFLGPTDHHKRKNKQGE
jgi:RHS repeat-associated protein